MDTRNALKPETLLIFDMTSYTIIRELARGATSIVYDAYYLDTLNQRKLVRIKECYPYKLNLKREENHLVCLPEEESLFLEMKDKLRDAYRFGNQFFQTDGLTNYTCNTYNIFEANNTIYVVMAYSQGEVLDYKEDRSIKDILTITKSVAKAILRMHQNGYLYLDIKPDNVFLLQDTLDLIQLFDFDTLFPISYEKRKNVDYQNKISYTEGFAPLEQALGNFNQLTIQSDIYGIGALLFYLLFHRVPTALDCEVQASYPFDHHLGYKDSLYMKLSDFLHNTLAFFYLDRYPSLDVVINKLDELISLSSKTTPFIAYCKIARPFVIGREKEIGELKEWHVSNQQILFVSGFGGIGKSSVVRAFLSETEDSVLYLNYQGSIQKTISDDYQFTINTISKDRNESANDYYKRKLKAMKLLCAKDNPIVVLDNCNTNELDHLKDLLDLNCRLIIITRNKELSGHYPTLEVLNLNRIYALNLFESYYPYSQRELGMVDEILEMVDYHTLVIEIIAKQIKASHLTVLKAHELVGKVGFSHMGNEKVHLIKDENAYYKTIKDILELLFTQSSITLEQQQILFICSLCHTTGVDKQILVDGLGLEDYNALNELYQDGWIYLDEMITLHPIIHEVILNWPLDYAYIDSSKKFYLYLSYLNQMENHVDFTLSLLYESMSYKELGLLEAYQKLALQMISKAPRDKEETVLSLGAYIVECTEDLEILVESNEILTSILVDQQKLDTVKKNLDNQYARVKDSENHYILAKHYYTFIDYYDNLLDGYYEVEDGPEYQIYLDLLKTTDKAIEHIEQTEKYDQIAQYLRCKALMLIRSAKQPVKQIKQLLERIENIIEENNYYYTKLSRDYQMTLAWYHLYVTYDKKELKQAILKALRITKVLGQQALDLVDELFSPLANISYELGEFKEAEAYLNKCISLCKSKEDLRMYQTKAIEMYSHLTEIYYRQDKVIEAKKTYELISQYTKEDKSLENHIFLAPGMMALLEAVKLENNS